MSPEPSPLAPFAAVAAEWLPKAAAAVGALAARVDELVDAGAVAAVEANVSTITAQLRALGMEVSA